MTAIPLARFLVDFGTDGVDGARAEASLIANANARVNESLARGHAEGRAAAEAEFGAKLEAQQQDFERRLAMARQDWAATEGAALSSALACAMGDLEARLADTTARVLQPFIQTEICRAAVAELVAAIGSIVAHGKATQVEITGPEDLLDVVRARLSDKVPATFTSSKTGDIRVAIDQTVLETRLVAWTAAIEEAVR